MKIAGSASGSGSISQRYRSADSDPCQNFMDLQHCQKELLFVSLSVGNGGKLLARCPSVGISVFEFSLMIREVTAKITSIADPKPDPHWFWSA